MEARSEKSRLVALLFCFFPGWLGVNRFTSGNEAPAS